MKIMIWSDVRCPFCYIGKRKFEKALDKFAHKDKVEVIWKSFQLDPNLKTQKELGVYDYFAKAKGLSQEQATQMFDNVTQVAKEIGLSFRIDKSTVSNSFNAHRLIQLAKTKNLGNEAEEQLFKAHFIEGKDIDENGVLMDIGITIGIDENEVKDTLLSSAFSEVVKRDEEEARSLGVRGVPFFVFNDKYAISGAQSPEIFLQTLERSWEEFKRENKSLITTKGESCSTDGTCE